ncbi:MAG TPA: DUF5996 family protein, partial [Rhizomicrobium sp.]|nr:DUF5996 family protein [Rhizomicrobium sp.]
LRYADWAGTCDALHLWTQVVGKVRLAQTPWLNHSWQTPLYVTSRGLSTGPIPYQHRYFDIEFDFMTHVLRLRSDTKEIALPLGAISVAEFYAQVMSALDTLETPVTIFAIPNEMPQATSFSQDTHIREYDPVFAHRFWRVLLQTDQIFKAFRTGFLGKASPVHFFWGSFDLAVTRFSGRRAPLHPGGVPHLPDAVAREAYSHEVSSAGFWPGNPGDAAFYSYAYPEPAGYREKKISPATAYFDTAFGEFILPYEEMHKTADPGATLMDFLASTYTAAADAANWDRTALECSMGRPGRPRPVAE